MNYMTGFNIKKIGASVSDLPNLPEGLLVNLSSMGGNPGNGRQLHLYLYKISELLYLHDMEEKVSILLEKNKDYNYLIFEFQICRKRK